MYQNPDQLGRLEYLPTPMGQGREVHVCLYPILAVVAPGIFAFLLVG